MGKNNFRKNAVTPHSISLKVYWLAHFTKYQWYNTLLTIDFFELLGGSLLHIGAQLLPSIMEFLGIELFHLCFQFIVFLKCGIQLGFAFQF